VLIFQRLSSETAAPSRRFSGLPRRPFSKRDPALRKIARRHFDMYAISFHRADADLRILPAVGDDLVLIIEQNHEAADREWISSTKPSVSDSSLVDPRCPEIEGTRRHACAKAAIMRAKLMAEKSCASRRKFVNSDDSKSLYMIK
jgi:hypothetical protein